MFFKRRSRANSYIDSDPPPRSQSYDDYEKNEKRPDSSRISQPLSSPTADDKEMSYPRTQQPQEPGYGARSMTAPMPNTANPTPPLSSGRMGAEPMPDLLAQAFNQAVQPYKERIDALEAQIQDMQNWVEQLEQQRAEVHSWIDKRGLRPGEFELGFFVAA